MDTDAGQTARQWLSQSTSGDEKDAEIARLRERLAFYQSFEGLIQDNIARSGELLRQAMDMRESAAVEIAAARAEADRRRADDRSRYRIQFSAMLDELTALQGQAERLARRLTDTLDEIEADLPQGALTPSLAEIDLGDDDTLKRALALDSGTHSLDIGSDTLPAENQPSAFGVPTAEQPLESAAAEEPEIATVDESSRIANVEHSAAPEHADDARTETAPLPPDTGAESPYLEQKLAGETLDIPRDIQPFAADEIASPRHFAADNDLALQPAYAPDVSSAGAPSTPVGLSANATIVLVHGVPRATTALSLKRYLEGLAHVGAVEPREFAEGILRLEVSGVRPLAFDDLRSWSDGPNLEPVHLRDNLVEVRLSH